MWLKGAALIASVGVHAVLVWAMWSVPVPRAEPVRVPVEMELRPFVRPVEARRTPVTENRKASARRRGPAVSAPIAVAATGSLSVLEGSAPEQQPSGEGDGDEEVGTTAPPPPPPPDTRAELIVMPRIAYPETARADDVEGVVRLFVKLDARGQVLEVEILEEPGSGLGDAARRAVMGATFRPATHLGAGVPTGFEYVYRFRLL